MCNLYNLKVERWELQAYYQANDDFRRDIESEEPAKDYVSKATPGLIVRQVEGRRILSEPMHWGWPNARGGDEVRNVRNYGSRFWKPALENPERRCLVPFTQFQEWTVEPDPRLERSVRIGSVWLTAQSARSPVSGVRASVATSSPSSRAATATATIRKSKRPRLPRTSLARFTQRRSRSFFTMRISTYGSPPRWTKHCRWRALIRANCLRSVD